MAKKMTKRQLLNYLIEKGFTMILVRTPSLSNKPEVLSGYLKIVDTAYDILSKMPEDSSYTDVMDWGYWDEV